MHNVKHIDQLLEKYWDAETTLAEEAQLMAYFKEGPVSSEHQAYAGLFDHYAYMQAQVSSHAASAGIEQSEAVVRPLSWTRWIPQVAAVLFGVLAVAFLMRQPGNGELQDASNVVALVDSDDPAQTEEALEVTREALAFLSAKLNKNATQIKEDIKPVGKAAIFKY